MRWCIVIELFIGNESIKIKSNVNMSVGDIERFNSDKNIDMDLVSLCRMIYPKNMLSSGSGATNADKAVARGNGLYFSKDLKVLDFMEMVKRDPSALSNINVNLANTEKEFARIIKNRSPLIINPHLYQMFLKKKKAKKDELIAKWQPKFTVDITQKNDELRHQISEHYGINPKRISKESVAISHNSNADKAELFEIMEVFNLQQEISNISKLEGLDEYTYSFIPFGSVSGRSSTFSNNIHGMTKDQFGIFSQKENGMRLVSIDFSQIELRLAASLWGDLAMQTVFNAGGDIHINTAKLIGGRDRQLAKALNYGLLYGMGVDGFMVYCAKDFGIILTHQEAEAYVKEFKKSYPSLFDKKVTEFTGITYKTKTLSREMHGQEVFAGAYDWKKYTIERNIQIQGEGADILKKSVIFLEQRLKGIGHIAFEIFDEVGFWIKDDSNIEIEVNSICDELTQYIFDASGFTIPIKISDRF